LGPQRAKKVLSDSQGLVDFAIGLVNSVLNLPDRQVKFFEEFKLQKNCEINLLIKTFWGLVEMMFGLVNVSFSLPEWQALKMTFFAPWDYWWSNGYLHNAQTMSYIFSLKMVSLTHLIVIETWCYNKSNRMEEINFPS